MVFRYNLYAFHCWILLLTQFSQDNAVVVNITTVDDSETPLPSDIRVTVSTDTDTTTVFNLRKVEHIDANVPVYSINTNKDGGLNVTKETEPEDKKLAYYQDLVNHAVMQIAQQTNVRGLGKKFFLTRGEYVKNNKKYAIIPRLRSKRDVPPHGNQSDEGYDVSEVPLTTVADFNRILLPSIKPLSKNKRYKRQAHSTFYIDVAAFLDSSRYTKFLQQASSSEANALKSIQEYYAFIFSSIDQIYQNFNASNYHLRVTLTKIITFKNETEFPLVYLPFETERKEWKVDTETVLMNFGEFLNSSAGRDLTFPYDHAMMFIGSDLWLNDTDLLGLASGFGKLCNDDGTSSTVVEDFGDYSAAFTGAHELGHIMSSQHDGYENPCEFTDRYLMASSDSDVTNTTLTHPWRFSNCTIDYFETFITDLLKTSRGQMCLANTLNVIGEFPDVSNRYLGQEIPRDKQCKLIYGVGSSMCSPLSTACRPGKDVDLGGWRKDMSQMPPFPCAELYCSSNDECPLYSTPPLAGTTCGCGKVCCQGNCIVDLHSPDASCDVWSNCSYVNCSDETSSLYCKLTCGVQIVNMTSSLTTTKKTTAVSTNMTSTSTTTSKTTSIEPASITGCLNGQKCSTVSSCHQGTACAKGTELSYNYWVMFTLMVYFVLAPCRVQLS